METIKIALADDHAIMRAGVIEVLQKTGRFEVLFDYDDGQALLDAMGEASQLPDVVLLDVYMPGMDGIKTASQITRHYPTVKILALSMMGDEQDVLSMVRSGAIGYILKGENPSVLIESIVTAHQEGITRSNTMSNALISAMNTKQVSHEISAKHQQFCLLAASDLTYTQISDELNVSPRTVDGYRDELFKRFSVKSRVGLVLYCLKHRLISLKNT